MEHVNDYYNKNMKSKKYLKCLFTAEQFDMERQKRIEPLKLLIDEHLKKQNLNEIRNMMKKYKIPKKDITGSVKLMYLDSLKSDRDYARRLRKFFGLSVFDVGFFNWLFYEVLGFKLKKSEPEEELNLKTLRQ